MKFFWRCLYVSVACLALGVACGDDGGNGGGGGSSDGDNNTQQITGPPVSLNQLQDKYGSAMCDRIFDCCTTEERDALTDGEIAVGTPVECRDSFGAYYGPQLAELQDAVDAGTVVYHADKAGNCVAWMEAQGCSGGISFESTEQPADCENSFEGQVEPGGECNMSEECSQGYCDQEYDDQGDPVGPGTCSGSAGDGGCDWDDDCSDGEYCNSNYDSETDEWTGTCETIGQAGDACSNNQGCEEELYCESEYDPDIGESVGTCEPKAAIGGSCSYGGCQDDGYCETSWDEEAGEQVGVCVAKGSAGDACEQSGQCNAQTYCDTSGDNPTCVTRKPDGEPCEGFDECQEDSWCGSTGDDPEAPSTCQSSGGGGEDMCTGN